MDPWERKRKLNWEKLVDVDCYWRNVAGDNVRTRRRVMKQDDRMSVCALTM